MVFVISTTRVSICFNSGQCLFDPLQFSLELTQLIQRDIDALFLNGAIGFGNLENEDSSRLVDVLAVGRGYLVAKDHLKVGQLLKPHQTCHIVEAVSFAGFCVDGSREGLDHRGFLDG